MGVTIHFSGKLDDPRVLPELILAAKHFCFQHHWDYQEIDQRIIGTVERWVPTPKDPETHTVEIQTSESPIDDTLRGIVIHPHPESETTCLTFNQQGELCFYLPQSDAGDYWESKLLFTKTQFAPLDIHIAICELLHLIQERYFPSLRVSDEGEYFETGNREQLAHKIGQLNAIMDHLEKKLADADGDDPAVNAIRDAVDEADRREGKPRKNKRGKLSIERGKKITHRDPEWNRGRGTSANKN